MAKVETLIEDQAILQRLALIQFPDPDVEAMARAYALLRDMPDNVFEASMEWIRTKRQSEREGARPPAPDVNLNNIN